jgi:hypothetical protein
MVGRGGGTIRAYPSTRVNVQWPPKGKHSKSIVFCIEHATNVIGA